MNGSLILEINMKWKSEGQLSVLNFFSALHFPIFTDQLLFLHRTVYLEALGIALP